MDKFDLISISFPVYNVSKTVELSLLSALDQTYPNIEFLIVDDCGSDNSMDIVNNIIHNSKRKESIRIIKHEKNLGLGEVRNTSIKNAKGKYIYFMDSDDVLSNNCIELLYNAIIKYKVDLVCGSYATFHEKPNKIDKEYKYKQIKILETNDEILNYFFKEKEYIFVYMWNKLYSINLLRKNNIYCKQPIVEDDFFLFQILLNVKSCCLVPDITYNYYYNTTSITNSQMKNNISYKVGNIFRNITINKYLYLKHYNKGIINNYIKLAIFSESVFRSNIIIKSQIINKTERKEILKDIFNLEPLNISLKEYISLPIKSQLKVLLYNLFSLNIYKINYFIIKYLCF